MSSWHRQGWIYAFQMAIPDYRESPIKIGYSDDPIQRLNTMKTYNPFPVICLGCWPSVKGVESERVIHAHFAHARMSREWFFPTPDLLAFIAEQSSKWEAMQILGEEYLRGRLKISKQYKAFYAGLKTTKARIDFEERWNANKLPPFEIAQFGWQL